MRLSGEADRGGVEAFLTQHSDSAMFPLSNLAHYGMAGGNDRAMRFWVSEGLTDVLGVTEAGMVMPVCPGLRLDGIRAALTGLVVIGVLGQAEQARAVIAALGLAGRRTTLDDDQPHFALQLARMIVPEGTGRLVSFTEAPRSTVLGWIYDYDTTALGVAPDLARQFGPATYDLYVAMGQHRVLMQGDVPLAMTGFNAKQQGCVQIGGVYTPPALRGRGQARRTVALHLAEARTQGVRRAVLFASGPAAIRAYEAFGFQRIGLWTLCLFAKPGVVG